MKKAKSSFRKEAGSATRCAGEMSAPMHSGGQVIRSCNWPVKNLRELAP